MSYTILPFKEQDRLGESKVKIVDTTHLVRPPMYVDLSNFTGQMGEKSIYFAPMRLQDRLEEGFVRLERGITGWGSKYVQFDKIEEIDTQCFVATAVYGNPEAPQVNALRAFRDDVLNQNPLGRLLTYFYYSGAGRRTAKFISQNVPSSIPVIKSGLDLLVEQYSKRIN